MSLPAETISVTALASAVRSASTQSADIPVSAYLGCLVFINMTSVPGTDTVTFALDGKDELSGNYYPIITSTALVAAETKATGSITLTGGASGSINTLTVGGVNIIPAGAVAFNTSLNQTATDLAAAINAASTTPRYTASAAGAVVTITAATGSGALPNGLVVTATLTTITATFVNMAGGVSGLTVLRVFPGLTAAGNLTVSDVLPKTVRVRTTHSALSNFTYSVAVQPMT